MKRVYLVCALVLAVDLPLLAVNVGPRHGRVNTMQLRPTEINPMVGAVVNSFTFAAPTATATSTATATATATVASGPQLVQQAVATGTSHNGITATFGAPTTADNFLVACVDDSGVDPVISVDGVSEVLGIESVSTGTAIETAILSTITAGGETTYHVRKTDDISRSTLWIAEFTLVIAGGEADTGATGVASSTVTTGSVTPISAHNLIVACGGWTANDYSTGPTNSFTRGTPAGGGSVWLESAYKTQTSATAASSGWGLTAGINWASAIVSFGAP